MLCYITLIKNPSFYRFKMSNTQVNQIQKKELLDMVSEIANYCKNKEIEGITTKKKLTSTGGKYKWTDGEEITYTCTDGVELM